MCLRASYLTQINNSVTFVKIGLRYISNVESMSKKFALEIPHFINNYFLDYRFIYLKTGAQQPEDFLQVGKIFHLKLTIALTRVMNFFPATL